MAPTTELRKKLESEINKNLSILEGCVDAVVTINQVGIIEFFNHAAETLFGYDRSEVIGENVLMLTPPEYHSKHDGFLKSYLDTKIAKVIGHGREVNALRKDGTQTPILLSLSEAMVEGEYVFTAFIKDYSEKKKNEEELVKLSLVASKTDNTVIITDKNRCVEWVNEGFSRMTGFALDEIKGKNPKELLQGTDTDAEAVQRMHERLMLKKPFTEVLLNYKKNGEPFWVTMNITPLLDKNDEVYKYIAIESDITTQRNLQYKLEENEKRLTETQKIAGLGTWEYDVMSEKVTWSMETFRIFGRDINLDAPNFISYIRLIYKEDRRKFIESIRQAVNEGKEYEIEIRHMLPNGVFKYTYGRGRPIWEKNKVVKILGVVLDITERKNFENELKKEKENAEESTRAKEMFLANTSHEIRTPMNAIIGITELLKQTNLDEQQHDYLDIIENSADNLLYILNDILDVSKIESGKLEFEQTGFVLTEVVKSVLKSSMFKAKAKNLELLCNCEKENDDLILLGDPVRLNQVLLNLVNNAIKFTEKGSVNIQLFLKSVVDNTATISFNIVDTGIGIPLEKQNLIFEDFQQADSSTTRKYGGTGLGLSISRKLIDLMGGRLQVQSQPGKGSHFSFELSFKKGTVHDIQESKMTHEADFERFDLKSKKLLIVEDQEFNLLVAERMLQPYGCLVDSASNGKEAIKKLSDKNYDLILMDIQMPVMDGIETTRFIREHMSPPKSTIPIIALTANAVKGDREKYLAFGMNNYLSKPFRTKELMSVILHELKLDLVTTEPFAGNKTDELTSGLFDLSQIIEMAGGSNHFVAKMIDSFMEQCKVAMAEINQYCGEQNYPKLAKVLHKHKSIFSFMGMNSLFDQMVGLEVMVGEEQPIDSIYNMVKSIEESLKTVYVELEKEQKNYL